MQVTWMREERVQLDWWWKARVRVNMEDGVEGSFMLKRCTDPNQDNLRHEYRVSRLLGIYMGLAGFVGRVFGDNRLPRIQKDTENEALLPLSNTFAPQGTSLSHRQQDPRGVANPDRTSGTPDFAKDEPGIAARMRSRVLESPGINPVSSPWQDFLRHLLQ